MQGNGAVLELVKRRFIAFVDIGEFGLKSVKLVFILGLGVHKLRQLGVQLGKIRSTAFNVFLSFKQKYFLLLVVRLHGLSECIFSVLQHLN